MAVVDLTGLPESIVMAVSQYVANIRRFYTCENADPNVGPLVTPDVVLTVTRVDTQRTEKETLDSRCDEGHF